MKVIFCAGQARSNGKGRSHCVIKKARSVHDLMKGKISSFEALIGSGHIDAKNREN